MLTFIGYFLEIHYGYDISGWAYVLPVITDLAIIQWVAK